MPPQSESGASLPSVTIIIPTYNEERFIEQCLRSVRAQRYPADRLEIIVVDNGSTDRTIELCEGRADRILRRPDLRVAGMRNAGASIAAGDLLAFLDADCSAAEDWIPAGVASIRETPSITGATYLVPAGAGWIESTWFSQELPGRRPVTHINAGNLFVERRTFELIRGFDETLLTGEDYEFAQRAWRHVKVIADDRIRVVHFGNPKTVGRFIQREIWHGLGALSSLKHDWRDKPFWGTVVFLAFTLLQIVGLGVFIGGRTPGLVVLSSAGLALLLLMTVTYRVRRGARMRRWPQLLALYYLFYLGRSIALLRVWSGRIEYRRQK